MGVVVSHLFDGLRMDVPNIEQTHAHLLCLRDLEVGIVTSMLFSCDNTGTFWRDRSVGFGSSLMAPVDC